MCLCFILVESGGGGEEIVGKDRAAESGYLEGHVL